MSDNLAPLSYENHDDNIFLGREITQAKTYSEETARKIDAEVALIIDRAYQTAKTVLEGNMDILHALTKLLMEKETVLGPELDDLIASLRPDFDFFGRKSVFHMPQHPVEPEAPATPEEKETSAEVVEDEEKKDPDA
jgi:cell division protease FtsH